MFTRWFLFRLFLIAAILVPAVRPASTLAWRSRAVDGQIGDGNPQSCTEEALDSALAAGGSWRFNCGLAPYTLVLTGSKTISQDTTLEGGQSQQITLSGAGHNRVFLVEAGVNLTLQNITVAEGHAGDGGGGGIYSEGTLILIGSQVRDSRAGNDGKGGGIYSAGGSVTLVDSTLVGNAAGSGGGLAADGRASLTQVAILDNTARVAGGLDVSGVISISQSLIHGNTAEDAGGVRSYAEMLEIADTMLSENRATGGQGGGGYGGGLFNAGRADLRRVTLRGNRAYWGGGIYQNVDLGGDLVIEASTLSDNRASGYGGGLYAASGDMAMLNVTLSANAAAEGGGALYQYGGNATLTHTTLRGNQALYGAGIYRDASEGSRVTLARSILADNASGNCDGAITSAGYNLADDTHCGLDQDGDRQDTAPLLKALASNGGPTATYLPDQSSPAIDAAPADGCPAFDQRGMARPLGAGCDLGAVEADPDGAILACGGDFTAVADTSLDQAHPDANFGADGQLGVGNSAGAGRHTLLAFDLGDSIPPGSALHRAELELSLLDDGTGPGPYNLAVHEIGTWDETGITWNTSPALGTRYGNRSDDADGGVLQIDVTTLVNRWLTGEAEATGLALVPGSDAEMSLLFASREGAEMPGQAPRLIVRCAPPQVPVPADETVADQAQQAGAGRLADATGTDPALQFIGSAVRFGNFQLGVPADVGTDPAGRANWFLDHYRDLLRVDDPASEFQLTRISDDGQNLFFRQRHQGIPVYGAELGLHFTDANLSSLGGAYVPGITLTPYPSLSAERAEELALLAAGEGATVAGDTQLRYLELGLLGIADGGLHLAWEVAIQDGMQPGATFVDAHSGEIVFVSPVIHEGYDLDLEDGNDKSPQDLCGLDEDDDIDWNDALPDSDLATNYFRAVHYYWSNTLARDSYDGDGEQMEVNIHVAYNPPNASYGVCDLFFFGHGTVSRDIVGHEFTHAVDESEGQLQYVNQSGALDESYADIFGYLLDQSNWLIGEGTTMAGPPAAGCVPTWAIRDMGNPQCFGQPVLASQYVNLPINNDNGGVHTNSGIHNKAAFLIIAGGDFNSYHIPGMGAAKAQHLFNGVLVTRLWSTSQFLDARNAAVADALQKVSQGLVGFNNTDVCTVRNAYAAVGLGWGDRDCDGQEDNVDPDQDGDGKADAADNCPIVWNPGQGDIDGDGTGDACDNDKDNDGRINTQDNCPTVANPTQADWNGNGVGDACDDSDGDWVMDNVDNCRSKANPGQEDQDLDGLGDICDTDRDGDGVGNLRDNCPTHWNPFQGDTTEVALGLPPDGVGDACDLCREVSSSDNGDSDHDGLANPCDPDDDGDGYPDENDNCPSVYNPSQLDWDDNGIGFACDPQEQETFGAILQDVNDRYSEMADFRTPIPVCPQCVGDYLSARYEIVINVQLPIGFSARVVDSSGAVVAKGTGSDVDQILRISPRVYAVTKLGGPGVQNADDTSVLPLTEFGADEMRYYLEIVPDSGTDLSQPYPLTIKIQEGTQAHTMYLPLVTLEP